MEELGKTIGENLVHLRKKAGLTQLEFGEKFSYSDKTVSKWEQGDIVPSVENLKAIADYYGVSVDFILSEHKNDDDFKKIVRGTPKYRNKVIMVSLYITVIFTIAGVIYLASIFNYKTADLSINRWWTVFLWSVPVSFVMIAFQSHKTFHSKRLSITYLSLAVWTVLLAAFLTFYYKGNYWYLFFIGIPVQIILVLMLYLK